MGQKLPYTPSLGKGAFHRITRFRWRLCEILTRSHPVRDYKVSIARCYSVQLELRRKEAPLLNIVFRRVIKPVEREHCWSRTVGWRETRVYSVRKLFQKGNYFIAEREERNVHIVSPGSGSVSIECTK